MSTRWARASKGSPAGKGLDFEAFGTLGAHLEHDFIVWGAFGSFSRTNFGLLGHFGEYLDQMFNFVNFRVTLGH